MTIEHIHTNTHGVDLSPGIGAAGSVKADHRVVTISAAAEVGSTYTFARVPSYVRLCDLSRFYPFASAAGNLDYNCGIFGVDGNITDDDDALFASRTSAINPPVAIIRTTNVAIDRGKPIWEFVDGQTEDPGGFLDIKITLVAGSQTTMGTETVLCLCVVYTID